jgi:hypothetical protein
MEAIEIKIKIQTAINTLTQDQLEKALDLLEDLKRSEEDETLALRSDPGFMEDYRQAKEDIRTGNTVSWKDIKRNV